MEEKLSLKNSAEELMQKKGHIKGKKLREQLSFIKEKEGRGGIEIIKKKIEEFGYSLDLEEIDPSSWYPVGLVPLLILILKDQLNWDDSNIFDFGKSASKPSIVEEVLGARYFTSLEKLFENLPKKWSRCFDFGRLEKSEFKKELKKMTVKVTDFGLHPVMCRYIEGLILGAVSYGFNNDNISIKEKECLYKGSDCDEFIIEW